MKKIILMLMFILGTFAFSETTTSEVQSFFSSKAQIYVSNQKDWFCIEVPGTDETECRKFNYLVNVVPVGNKYRISYTPIDNVNSRKNQNTPVTDSYDITVDYVFSAGTETKKGKKYERTDFQMLSESELNALLKSKSAKRLNSETEKNTKAYLDWLFHNNN